MPASLSIYNACILFCDCLKITKQITQKHTNTRNTSIIFMTAITKKRNNLFSFEEQKKIKKEIKNMILGWQLLFSAKISSYIMLVCFFSVQHFAAKNEEHLHSSKVITIIIRIMLIWIITATGARCGVTATSPSTKSIRRSSLSQWAQFMVLDN